MKAIVLKRENLGGDEIVVAATAQQDDKVLVGVAHLTVKDIPFE